MGTPRGGGLGWGAAQESPVHASCPNGRNKRERAFRVVKSLLKLRPIYHWRQPRVEAHIFIVFLAFLLAKVLELKLRAAGLELSIAHALDQLSELKAVEHTWEEQAIVVQATRPHPLTERILAALGVRLANPVVRVTRLEPLAT